MDLRSELAAPHCGAPALAPATSPAQAQERIAGSSAAQGRQDIAWAWIGTPTLRYPHTALGSSWHGGSLHVVSSKDGIESVLSLPLNRVFEDLTVRLVDLDADGRDEIVVVESDTFKGASLSVYGLRAGRVVELARGPFVGLPFRWLNPVGAADFDGDGRLDLAAVITPHIGGQLTFYHYRPPHLTPFAVASDVSNHKMGSPEQQLAVILTEPNKRPIVIVPDMTLKALYALRWAGSSEKGRWEEIKTPLALPARIERMERLAPWFDGAHIAAGACALLADQTWRRITLMR